MSKIISPERFTELKAKVKAEMLRRNQSGSVASYGGTEYDYTVVPADGKIIKEEHREKLIVPMNAVNSDQVPLSQVSFVNDNEITTLETKINAWATRSLTDKSGSDCKSGCTGTCYTGCSTGCSGCSGCSGTCKSGCTSCSGCHGCSGCTSYCVDHCNNSCSGTCKGGCYGGCDGRCINSCSTECSHTAN